MNHSSVHTLTIDGKKFKGSAIVNFCMESGRDDLLQLGLFVKNWIGGSDFLELKTSGSTGQPKTILVEKDQMLASATLTAEFFRFEKGQSALLCLPVQYIAGKMMVVRAMFSELNLVCIPPSGDPLASLPGKTIIDFAPLLPMQLTNATSTATIKTILLGGAPVDSQLETRLQSFPSEIFHGYGMTETLSHVALRRVNGQQRSGVYEALTGILFETDERECLVIHVPFLNDPVMTNDVVELHSATSFAWKGRFDFVVNSGGIKLYPEEIERKIAGFIRSPYFTAGVPDERFGEQLCLFIESDDLNEAQLDLLEEKIDAALDKFERPRKIVTVREFKRTVSGKINRNETVRKFFSW